MVVVAGVVVVVGAGASKVKFMAYINMAAIDTQLRR